ncbi:MAG: hypothetical protein IKA36_06015 [Clostridia bacterium]|nr:hypothetical protein [Clostridia bacterium]
MKQFFVDQYNDEYRSQIVRLLDVNQTSKVETDDDSVEALIFRIIRARREYFRRLYQQN